MSNMRSLHVALNSYLVEQGHWPQVPQDLAGSETAYEDWWIETLEPYGATPKTWICPVLEAGGLQYGEGRPVRLHYIPTQFDANPISPSRWPTQPWLIERADAHGRGALILFPDGSIKDMHTVLKDAGMEP